MIYYNLIIIWSHIYPLIIYADIESLTKKIDGCANNSESSSKTKIVEHILCGYSMSVIWGFDHVENKHFFYFFRRTCKKYNWQWKDQKISVNKGRIKIKARYKSMLYLWKNNPKAY